MISAFFASNAAEVEVCPVLPCCSLSKIAAVEAENWGKLDPAPAFPFTGKLFICADHAGPLKFGAFDCCGVAEAVVLADALVKCDA